MIQIKRDKKKVGGQARGLAHFLVTTCRMAGRLGSLYHCTLSSVSAELRSGLLFVGQAPDESLILISANDWGDGARPRRRGVSLLVCLQQSILLCCVRLIPTHSMEYREEGLKRVFSSVDGRCEFLPIIL